MKLLEGLKGIAEATWEKYFTLYCVDLGQFVRWMESLEGAVRLADQRGSKPGQFKIRFAILDYISLKKLCNFFQLVKAGVVSDKNSRWGDNLRLNGHNDIVALMLPLVFTLIVTEYGEDMRTSDLKVSYCVATLPYMSRGTQVTLATDAPVEWQDWPLLPPFARANMHPHDAVAVLLLEHLVDIHAHQQQQPLPPGEDEKHYLRIPDSVAQGAAAQLVRIGEQSQGKCHAYSSNC